MWLDHVDFGDYSLHAVQSELTGSLLLQLSLSSICEMLHVKSQDDKDMLRGEDLQDLSADTTSHV